MGTARARSRESGVARKERAARIVSSLHVLYPQATCALHHRSAFELVVSTILSAQSTDETVNKVTPDLFKKYPDASALAAADPATIEQLIYRTGFFRQKTKSLIGASRVMCEQFGGDVPDTMENLLQLPGVARKTANVVLGTWFGKNEGVVVDTHVGRLAERLRLTWSGKDSKDAVKIEQDLQQVIPQGEWTFFSHALIWHGRKICTARKPKCGECALAPDCPSAFKVDAEKPGETRAASRAAKKGTPSRPAKSSQAAAGGATSRPKPKTARRK